MSDQDGPKVSFPWEPKRRGKRENEDGEGEPSHNGPPDSAESPAAGEAGARPAFPGESTSEYSVGEAFLKSAARAEISMDAPDAIEATREVALPFRQSRSRRDSAISEEIRAQWEAQPRVASRFKRWLYSDPAVRWFHSLPRATRAAVVRSVWIVATSGLIVGVFAASVFGIYPRVENYVRPMFAPKPDEPVRFFPREDMPFDFVEERTVSAGDFKMGVDCIWVTPDPLSNWAIDRNGLELVSGDGSVASLDVRENWDGLLRFYFGAGDVSADMAAYIKIPIIEGGLWTVARFGTHKLYSQGGPVPPSYLLGPFRFSE